jgi:DNA ligase-1
MTTPKYTPTPSDMNSLLDCLNDIRDTSSTKAKKELLKFYLGYTQFKQLVEAILNPYWRYGITDYTPPTLGKITGISFYELLELLEDLHTRVVTGNVARLQAGCMVAGGVPADLMLRILNKDPKAGFGATLVNAVCPGLLPEFPYMRCSLPEKSNMKKWDWLKGIIIQLKADGMFMNVDHDHAGQVQLMSRQGQIFPTKGFEAFHEEVRCTLKPGTQTHGEMVVLFQGKVLDRQTGNGIINSVAQEGAWPVGCLIKFMAWDQIPLDEVRPKGKYKVRYEDRIMDLEHQLEGYDISLKVIDWRRVYSKKEAYEFFAEILKGGNPWSKEGAVGKDPEMFWADGTSKDQVKLKLEFCVDLKFKGLTEGKGKFASTFGAIMLESSDGLLKVNCSGMDDKTRQWIYDNRVELQDSIVAVEANAVFAPSDSNPNYSLSHPRFIECRSRADKSVADTLQQILDQEQAAINAAAAIEN